MVQAQSNSKVLSCLCKSLTDSQINELGWRAEEIEDIGLNTDQTRAVRSFGLAANELANVFNNLSVQHVVVVSQFVNVLVDRRAINNVDTWVCLHAALRF